MDDIPNMHFDWGNSNYNFISNAKNEESKDRSKKNLEVYKKDDKSMRYKNFVLDVDNIGNKKIEYTVKRIE